MGQSETVIDLAKKENGILCLLKAKWDDYHRFKPLCCVDTMPYSRGQCWVLGLKSPCETYWLDADVGFIGYNWPYRFNSIRQRAIPELEQLPMRSQYTWLNKNVKTLSRIMIRPAYRGRGYARYLLANTIGLVDANYVECLTFTAGIAHLLVETGFINYGLTGGMQCDYFLWQRNQPIISKSMPAT